jgi:predicted S18 family serine protease
MAEGTTSWTNSIVIVAAITGVFSVATTIVAQRSFADKTICGIKEPEMKKLLQDYNDNMRATLEYYSRIFSLNSELTNQYANYVAALQSKLQSLGTKHLRKEEFTAADFAMPTSQSQDSGTIKKELEQLFAKASTETTNFGTTLSRLYAVCPR